LLRVRDQNIQFIEQLPLIWRGERRMNAFSVDAIGSAGSPLQHRRKANSFDGLRLIGALMVLVGHAFIISGEAAPLLLGRGLHQLGIWLFFAVSGYLITQSWTADARPLVYARKRALRILPGLWLLLAVSVLVLGPIATSLPLHDYFTSTATLKYALKNALLLTSWSLPGVFAGAPVAGQMNGSLWSLPIECMLYAVVPIAVWLFARSRAVTILLLGSAPFLVIAVFFLRPGLLSTSLFGVNLGWGFAAAPLFLSGCLLRLSGFPVWAGRSAAVASIGALALLAIGAVLLRENTVVAVLFAMPFATLVLLVGCSSWLQSHLLEKIGDLSYGIYLWAFPIQQLVHQRMGGGGVLNIAVSLPIVAALAAISWHFVEKPALRFKPGGSRRRLPQFDVPQPLRSEPGPGPIKQLRS
jgi:peptidoglycan/LPS O-acetylase OafA/YrhL